MKLKARLYGVDGVTRALQRVGRVASRPVLEQSARAGAEVIAIEARNLAPVRSGQLRDSIDVTVDPASVAAIGVSRLGVAVFVGPTFPDGWYGGMVEFGTAHTPAQPFMRPAFDAKRGEALAAMAATLRVEFRRAV